MPSLELAQIVKGNRIISFTYYQSINRFQRRLSRQSSQSLRLSTALKNYHPWVLYLSHEQPSPPVMYLIIILHSCKKIYIMKGRNVEDACTLVILSGKGEANLANDQESTCAELRERHVRGSLPHFWHPASLATSKGEVTGLQLPAATPCMCHNPDANPKARSPTAR